MTWLLGKVTGALSGAWGYIASAGVALGAVLIVLFQAKKAGRDEVKAAAAEKEVENAKTRNEVDREVATTKPDAVVERLSKYRRD